MATFMEEYAGHKMFFIFLVTYVQDIFRPDNCVASYARDAHGNVCRSCEVSLLATDSNDSFNVSTDFSKTLQYQIS